ncbi:hypothetical protein ACFZBC_14485 [Streptomyces luteogriseus]|uniref:hypothetical protein n=1 Tax=Streptomyces luteogriseus TaxID=68233 RepID=UPI0036E6EDFA
MPVPPTGRRTAEPARISPEGRFPAWRTDQQSAPSSAAGGATAPTCYLERRGGVFYHALAAWAPPAEHPAEAARCPGIALRIRTSSPLEA